MSKFDNTYHQESERVYENARVAAAEYVLAHDERDREIVIDTTGSALKWAFWAAVPGCVSAGALAMGAPPFLVAMANVAAVPFLDTTSPGAGNITALGVTGAAALGFGPLGQGIAATVTLATLGRHFAGQEDPWARERHFVRGNPHFSFEQSTFRKHVFASVLASSALAAGLAMYAAQKSPADIKDLCCLLMNCTNPAPVKLPPAKTSDAGALHRDFQLSSGAFATAETNEKGEASYTLVVPMGLGAEPALRLS